MLYDTYKGNIENLIKVAMQDVRKSKEAKADETYQQAIVDAVEFDTVDANLRLSTYRGLKNAVQNAEIDAKRNLTDDEFIPVVKKEIKSYQAFIDEVGDSPSAVTAVKLKQDSVNLLMQFLPKQMTSGDVKNLILSVIEQEGISSVKEQGKLMGKLMPQIKGKFDGKEAGNMAKAILSEKEDN